MIRQGVGSTVGTVPTVRNRVPLFNEVNILPVKYMLDT